MIPDDSMPSDVHDHVQVGPVGGLVHLHGGVGDGLDLRAAAVLLGVKNVAIPARTHMIASVIIWHQLLASTEEGVEYIVMVVW